MRRSLRSASCSRRLAPEPGCCTEPGRPGACAFPALPVSAAFGNNMDQRFHSIIFLGSLSAASLIFGLPQYTNAARGLMAIPATIILLFSPNDVAAGPAAYLATLIWFFFCVFLILVLLVCLFTAAAMSAWSLFRHTKTVRLRRAHSLIQIAVSLMWILGLAAFDVYPVPQNPPFEQSALLYIFPAAMLLNAVSQSLHPRVPQQA